MEGPDVVGWALQSGPLHSHGPGDSDGRTPLPLPGGVGRVAIQFAGNSRADATGFRAAETGANIAAAANTATRGSAIIGVAIRIGVWFTAAVGKTRRGETGEPEADGKCDYGGDCCQGYRGFLHLVFRIFS
jgi:hypothetical protein